MAARFTNALTSVAAPMPSTHYPSPGRDPPGRAGKLMLPGPRSGGTTCVIARAPGTN